jgi:hypothetical protein
MREKPKHILVSAITTSVKCELCLKDSSLSSFVMDGQEKELSAALDGFYRDHSNCNKTIQITLDKEQLYYINKIADSPEKFAMNAIRKEVANLRKKDKN